MILETAALEIGPTYSKCDVKQIIGAWIELKEYVNNAEGFHAGLCYSENMAPTYQGRGWVNPRYAFTDLYTSPNIIRVIKPEEWDGLGT